MSGPTEGNLNSTNPAAPSGKQNVAFQGSSPYTDSSTGNIERDISAYPEPATSSLEGTIMLAGDIGGSADVPKVVGVQGVPVSSTSPTNGQVLQYNSGSGLYVPTTPSGGSGIGPVAPFSTMLAPASITPPVLSDLTWGNQGSVTASYNAGGALYVSGSVAGTNVVFLYKAAPATPWTLTVGVVPGCGAPSANGNEAGLVLRESSTGKILAIWVGTSSGGSSPIIIGDRYSSYTFFTSNAFSSYNLWPSPLAWLQITNNGTNLLLSIAVDGQNFKQIYSESLTASFTSSPNQIGIGLSTVSASYTTDALFVHWAGI